MAFTEYFCERINLRVKSGREYLMEKEFMNGLVAKYMM